MHVLVTGLGIMVTDEHCMCSLMVKEGHICVVVVSG